MNDAPPNAMVDVEAEKAVLGLMMASKTNIEPAVDLLASRDFHSAQHGLIFAALVSLWSEDAPTEPIAVIRFLVEQGEITRAGGADYLTSMYAAAPMQPGTIGHYAGIVADWSRRRRLRVAGVEVVQAANNLNLTVAEAAERAERAIADTASIGQTTENVFLGDVIDSEHQHMRDIAAGKVPPSISTGFLDLDDLLGGWFPGQLIIPAGRPGSGKSLACLAWALTAAKAGWPVLMFPMEMKLRETLYRMWSNLSKVPLNQFRQFRFTPDEEIKVERAKETLRKLPIVINDKAQSVPAIRSASRRFHQKYGRTGLVIADYVQRMDLPKADRYDLAVGEAIKSFKSLAGELDCTVIAVCQLNRASEGRTGKIPQLSDLRDSGQLEQEADVVVLVHRDDYYDKESPRAGEADFIVAKNRSGPTDTVTVAAQLHVARFADMARA